MSKSARDAYDAAREKYRKDGEQKNLDEMRKIAEEQHKIRKDREAVKAAAKAERSAIGNKAESSPVPSETALRRVVALGVDYDLYKGGYKQKLEESLKRDPLNERLLKLLPPKGVKGIRANKALSEKFYEKTKGMQLDGNQIRVLAAMTPSEVLRNQGDTTLAKEFSQHAVRSGNYWKDRRTGTSFQIGEAHTRELLAHDTARELLKLKPHESPGTAQNPLNINIFGWTGG